MTKSSRFVRRCTVDVISAAGRRTCLRRGMKKRVSQISESLQLPSCRWINVPKRHGMLLVIFILWGDYGIATPTRLELLLIDLRLAPVFFLYLLRGNTCILSNSVISLFFICPPARYTFFKFHMRRLLLSRKMPIECLSLS